MHGCIFETGRLSRLIASEKDHWRKKRNALVARLRREGYLDDDVDKKDEKVLLDERGDIVHDEVDD